jgi:ribosomal protein L37AE/L43A
VTETRAAVFYCPFCAEEHLHPVEQHGGWECRSCLRVFAVKVLGLASRAASLGGPAEPRRQP